ncbi:hypothetical protein FSP39_015159 [Pinctada imbricata]|uniref:NAD-dependent epimerase/dehydratase domain-containing protein n=1 Tax=Pinctada imbricata TaxID=66713 RepID=A0AA88Y0K6_PINIB|nr:hypothetical protein FSP39_015159 [Pinctada imbricata]
MVNPKVQSELSEDPHYAHRLLLCTGFIGRNLVYHLLANDLASKIRVADKVPPQMAWLSGKHQEAFSSPIVEFKHSNLINPGSVEKAFSDESGNFDFVINLAAETKYGQSNAVYEEGIVRLSMNCAEEAARRSVRLYVEFSSGQMYSSDKKKCTEGGKVEPWTHLAKNKLEVEQRLQTIPELNYIIVRPAVVYGLGDKMGLTPRLIIGAIYKYIRQKMKMLWTKDLKMNTVHVDDVCRAVCHLCNHGKRGETYNIVDSGDTTQGKISEAVADIFEIRYDFVGSVMSNMAKVNMSSVVEDINEKHMGPWADACNRDGISNTPLTPFIDQELLYNKHLYLDGSKLQQTGFSLSIPQMSIEPLKLVLDDYIKQGLFPPSLLSAELLWNGKQESEDELEGGMS